MGTLRTGVDDEASEMGDKLVGWLLLLAFLAIFVFAIVTVSRAVGNSMDASPHTRTGIGRL